MRAFTFLLFFPLVSSLNAQIVNIENKRVYDDTSGWYGNLDGIFSFVQNKDFLYQLNVRARIQYKTKKHYFLFLQDFVYSGGQKVYANSGMGHFRYAYRIKQSHLKWESYFQTQYNQILRQRVRVLLGTGLRWKFVKKEKINSFFGSSIFYEYEELQAENEFNDDFRWSNYLSWFIKMKQISFSATTYYQPLLSNFNDFRFAGQYSLYSSLNKELKLKTECSIFYDSRPPSNVKSTLLSFMIGLSYEFGK